MTHGHQLIDMYLSRIPGHNMFATRRFHPAQQSSMGKLLPCLRIQRAQIRAISRESIKADVFTKFPNSQRSSVIPGHRVLCTSRSTTSRQATWASQTSPLEDSGGPVHCLRSASIRTRGTAEESRIPIAKAADWFRGPRTSPYCCTRCAYVLGRPSKAHTAK